MIWGISVFVSSLNFLLSRVEHKHCNFRAWPTNQTETLLLSLSAPPEALRQQGMGMSLYPILEFSNATGTPVNGSLVLQKGDNLTITCYSHLAVQWIVTQGEDSYVSFSLHAG